MTKDKFISILKTPANGYSFKFDKFSGFAVRLSENNYGIMIDEQKNAMVHGDEDDTEPEYWGQYKSPEDMLRNFMVDGKNFADTILPDIKELIILRA